ncbi:MAG: flavoprotein [Victivallaceae bacterium]
MATAEKSLIVLGVTGGIACYKAADLCSKLVQHGYEVQVIMTENSRQFVSKLTFQTLSRNAVVCGVFDTPEVWKPEHVALAERAALLVVAPCTANFIGKFASGIADDALTTFAITRRSPVLLAPAMNPAMWSNPAVEANCATLRKRGINFIGPNSGHVACGENTNPGRMSEPLEILSAVQALIPAKAELPNL